MCDCKVCFVCFDHAALEAIGEGLEFTYQAVRLN